MVTDENNTPINDVSELSISDVEGFLKLLEADGKYLFSNVPMDKRTITFTKKRLSDYQRNVLAGRFDDNKVASGISIQMLSAQQQRLWVL